ncbi:MAG: Crp/Fnr family transcriptional regulator [Desulfovibrionaceae bacterium]
MLTVEKVLLLSSVGFFADLPGDMLANIASMFEEVEILRGEHVVVKGDFGTSLYLVATGSVRVHDGDKEFAVLGERDIFGELAALSPEPRTATVTAVEDAILLKIEHEALYELIAEHTELAKNIIRFLCSRYRESITHGH